MPRTVGTTSASGTKIGLVGGTQLDLRLSLAKRPRADRDADRVADQIGVVELDARALGAVVVEHLDAGFVSSS